MKKLYNTLKIRALLSAAVFLFLNAFLLLTIPAYSQNDGTNYSVPALQPQSSFATEIQENEIISEGIEVIPYDGFADPFAGEEKGAIGGNNEPQLMPPPGNDNCAAGLNPPYVLSPNVGCLSGSLNGNNPGPAATVEVGETFGCLTGPPTRSVWYSFIATQAAMWVATKQTSTPFVCSNNYGVRVYRYAGTCPPPAGAVGCKIYTMYSANQIYNVLNMASLIPGTTYLVQVVCNPICGYYDFCIKLGTPTTCTTCGNTCGPICAFAQPIPPTPTQVVAICPGYPMSPPVNQGDIQTNCYSFTAPNDTVNMQQIVFAYCSPGNTISFTYSLYTNACGLIQSGNVFANNMITGLTVGLTYQICYTLQAACSWDSLIYPYLYTTSSALPVELVTFDAMAVKNKVQLLWTTASEINSKEFVIEKTFDGRDFTEVNRIRAAGNSTGLLNYKAEDTNPSIGNNYYRLKQIDFDGSFAYSKIVGALFSMSESDIYFVPNPANDETHIKFKESDNTPAQIKITDMKGRIIFDKQFITQEGTNIIPVSMNEFPNGIYTVQLITANQSLTGKLVKE